MQTPPKRASKMNKWSTSLPSMISLTSDVQFSYDPIFSQSPSTATTPPNLRNQAGGSLNDLSILIQTSSPSMHYNQYPKALNSFYATSIEHETTIRTTHEQFVPHDELLQSLVAYADSFELDSSIYSIQETKHQPTSICTPRRRTQSSTTHIGSMLENDLLMRHKSCDDLSGAGSITSSSKPTTIMPRETKFVPSETHPQFFFAAKANENTAMNHRVFQNNSKEKYYEEATPTTTDGSRNDWALSSDTMKELNKSSAEYFGNYDATTNIGDLNSQILKDLDYFSSMAATMNFAQEAPTPIPPPPPPVVIRKKSKDLTLKQQVDIQLLRPPTPPPPAPIIIREVRHKPPPSRKPTVIHRNLENNGQIRLSKTPPPIVLRERPPLPPKRDHPSSPTIFYHHLPTPPPSPPTVVVERLRAHASNIIQKPPPILVEKWLPYPPEQKRRVIYERASPLPVSNNHPTHRPSKNIILEYDNVNVIINKDVKQRKEVKRISPNQYVRQFGNSLYSNETLNQILNNSTCKSQVQAEHPHQYYENYTPIFQ